MAHPQTQYHLLRIPPELRNRIYELTLCVSPAGTKTRLGKSPTKKMRSNKRQTTKPSVLALLQTCQQIRNEAQGIFYEVNEITIDAWDLHDFMCASTQARLSCIRYITIVILPAGENLSWILRQLVRFKHLRSLAVNVIAIQHPQHKISSLMSRYTDGEKYLVKRALSRLLQLERIDMHAIFCDWTVIEKTRMELQQTIGRNKMRRAARVEEQKQLTGKGIDEGTADLKGGRRVRDVWSLLSR